MNLFGPRHFIREAQVDISNICYPLFERLSFNYFHYFRMYKDGSALVLYSRMDWNDYFCDMDYKAEIPLPDHKIKLGKPTLCLWQGTLQDQVVKDAQNLFNLYHPLGITIAHKDYFESFVFAAHQGNNNVINTYFNNTELLLNFIDIFKSKAINLIKEAEKCKVIIPTPNRPDEINILNNLSSALTIKGNYGKVEITIKEMETLRLLRQGLTAKEIASRFSRSPRTIESHLDNLKDKLGCNKKSQLMSIAVNNGI